MSYKLSKKYALSASQGASQKTSGRMIVVHSTANIGASAENNASFEKRTWYSNGAYVHFIAGDGVVFQVGEPGYVAWGAGQTANALAPVQIEMEETNDHAKFLRIVQTTAELVKDMAKKYNVPLTLDSSSSTGVKTHKWCANRWHETDHTDPYTYFNRMGYGKNAFAKALTDGKTAVNKPQKSEYFDWRPEYIYTKKSVAAHKNASEIGTSKNVVKVYKAGTKLQTKKQDGHRFQLKDNTWISANKDFVNNLYYVAGSGIKVVKSVNGTNRYKDLALSKKVDHFEAGTEFSVDKVVAYGSISRIQLGNGLFISGNKLINKYVE